MSTVSEIEVNIHVDALPEKVWALVGDLTRMGEWSPECTGVEWKHGAAGPAVGASFKGHNKKGWRRWSTNGRIAVFEPGRALVFDVDWLGLPVARWGYRVEPDGDGARLAETFEDHRGGLFRALGGHLRGVEDVSDHNRDGMEQTLQRIRTVAESPG
jgi:uncharacterized protein YndB with AHSA1/START domain